ncbi:MAG: hypothetical protein Q8O87_01685 [bacterium]|nr:hypothetical protein [bacterium]
MFNNKYYIIFLAIIAGGLSVYSVSVQGWYPIAVVNSNWIMTSSLQKHSAAAFKYYTRALGGEGLPRNIDQELRRATLDKIIENILIHDELETRVGDQVDNLVASKLYDLKMSDIEMDKAALALYGLNFLEFKELVLIPQAQRELLATRLLVEDIDFEAWLEEVKSDSSVIIFTPRLRWSGSEVEID